MEKTRKLTEASLLTAIFVVVTIISVGSGIGYGIYLDYIVPLFYFIIYLKCGSKYTVLSAMSAIFVVVTIISVGSGIGYGIYLDYIVPLFYFIIYLKCGSKYTVLSAMSGLMIVFAVLGNPGTAIWASQGIILGILCGILSEKKTSLMDDLLLGTLIGSIIMVFIDIYASKLIGYSFIQDFKETISYMAKYMTKNVPSFSNFPPEFIQSYFSTVFYVSITLIPLGTDFKETISYMAKYMTKNVPSFSNFPPEFIQSYFSTVFYVSITLIPLGTVVGVYIIGLFVGNRLNVLKGETKKKYEVIRHFRTFSRMTFCSRNLFYIMVIYTMTFSLMNKYGIKTNMAYIDTIMNCFFYSGLYFLIRDSMAYIDTIMNCFFYSGLYFLIRDSIAGIQGYMLTKGKSMGQVRLFTILYLFILLSYFWLAAIIAILYFMSIDVKYGLREFYCEKMSTLLTN